MSNEFVTKITKICKVKKKKKKVISLNTLLLCRAEALHEFGMKPTSENG